MELINIDKWEDFERAWILAMDTKKPIFVEADGIQSVMMTTDVYEALTGEKITLEDYDILELVDDEG